MQGRVSTFLEAVCLSCVRPTGGGCKKGRPVPLESAG